MGDSVLRWDIYDIADELADVPGQLATRMTSDELYDICQELNGLVRRLFDASMVAGSVGPWPDYEGGGE